VTQDEDIDDKTFFFTDETDRSMVQDLARENGKQGSESQPLNFFPNGDNPDEYNGLFSPETVTPTPKYFGPDYKWHFCSYEGEVCRCGCPGSGRRLVRYGSTGPKSLYDGSNPTFLADHPEIVRFDYQEFKSEDPSYELVCTENSFVHRDPFPGEKKHCECAFMDGPEPSCPTPTPAADHDAYNSDDFNSKLLSGVLSPESKPTAEPTPIPTLLAFAPTPQPTPYINPNKYKWTVCAEEGHQCVCGGGEDSLARYGFTGTPEMYEYGSAYFHENPGIRRFDYAVFPENSEGKDFKFTCSQGAFAGSDPFPGQEKHCECSHESKNTEHIHIKSRIQKDAEAAAANDDDIDLDESVYNPFYEKATAAIGKAKRAAAQKPVTAKTFMETHPIEDGEEAAAAMRTAGGGVRLEVSTRAVIAAFASGLAAMVVLAVVAKRAAFSSIVKSNNGDKASGAHLVGEGSQLLGSRGGQGAAGAHGGSSSSHGSMV